MLNVVKGQIIVHDKRLCALVEKGKSLGFLLGILSSFEKLIIMHNS